MKEEVQLSSTTARRQGAAWENVPGISTLRLVRANVRGGTQTVLQQAAERQASACPREILAVK